MHTVKSSDLVRSSGTILVAEDFEPARRLLETLLARQGYRVLAADGGRQALAMAAADPPDMVLTDLKMPGGDGWRATTSGPARPAATPQAWPPATNL